MLGFNIADSRKNFFDRQAVLQYVDQKTRRVLSRFGAYVRQRAITSMVGHTIRKITKKTKFSNVAGVSAPGRPPSVHEGGLVRYLYFAFDREQKSVVIGPALYKPREYVVPKVLEEGGRVSARTRDGKITVMKYRPRPFMLPAFQAELPMAAKGYQE